MALARRIDELEARVGVVEAEQTRIGDEWRVVQLAPLVNGPLLGMNR